MTFTVPFSKGRISRCSHGATPALLRFVFIRARSALEIMGQSGYPAGLGPKCEVSVIKRMHRGVTEGAGSWRLDRQRLCDALVISASLPELPSNVKRADALRGSDGRAR